jgi:hypothetical protein
VSDEAGSWAVAMFGMQNVPVDFPSDIEARYLIEKQDWQSSIRKAIDYAIKQAE